MRQTRNCSLEMFQGYQDDKGLLFRNRNQQEKKGNSPEPGERAEGKKTKTCQPARKRSSLVERKCSPVGSSRILELQPKPEAQRQTGFLQIVMCKDLNANGTKLS